MAADPVTREGAALLPCPFCGPVEGAPFLMDGNGDHWVVCEGCASNGPAVRTRKAATTAWNTRAALSTPQPAASAGVEAQGCEDSGIVAELLALVQLKYGNLSDRANEVMRKGEELHARLLAAALAAQPQPQGALPDGWQRGDEDAMFDALMSRALRGEIEMTMSGGKLIWRVAEEPATLAQPAAAPVGEAEAVALAKASVKLDDASEGSTDRYDLASHAWEDAVAAYRSALATRPDGGDAA